MNKYLPRFKPEVYLRFLNQKSIELFDSGKYKNIIIFHAIEKNKNYSGLSIEECLDQAILATRFEEGL
jgi:hypothetical protein